MDDKITAIQKSTKPRFDWPFYQKVVEWLRLHFSFYYEIRVDPEHRLEISYHRKGEQPSNDQERQMVAVKKKAEIQKAMQSEKTDFLDKRIMAIQQSTRTKSPFFQRANEWLRLHSKLYYQVRIQPLYRYNNIDDQIVAIERSTRTTIKYLQPLHEKLRQKESWYYKWHLNPWSNTIHLVSLIFSFAVIGTLIFATVAITGKNQSKADRKDMAQADIFQPRAGEKEEAGRRTENSKTFSVKLPDGRMQYRIAADSGPIHYKDNPDDSKENWKDIDTDIETIGNRQEVRKVPYMGEFLDTPGYLITDKKSKDWVREEFLGPAGASDDNSNISNGNSNSDASSSQSSDAANANTNLSSNLNGNANANANDNSNGNLNENRNINENANGNTNAPISLLQKARAVGDKLTTAESTIDGNKKIYRDVYPDTDFIIEATRQGMKGNVVIKGPNAPKEFKFKLTSSQGPTKNKHAKNQTKNNLDTLSSINYGSLKTFAKVWDGKADREPDANGDLIGYDMTLDDSGILAVSVNPPADVVYPVTIDPATYNESASADDASNYGTTAPGDGNYSESATTATLGFNGTNYNIFGTRFGSVTIPQYAQINTASLNLTSNASSTTGLNVIINGEKVADAGVFASSTHEPYDAYLNKTATERSLTIGGRPWSAGGAEDTPDISGIVQEIVDQSAWASGNGMAFIVTNSGTTNATRVIRTYDYAGNTSGPKLNVTYTATTAVRIWDGGGDDTACGGAGTANNWSCATNWSDNTVPGSGDIAVFNGTSTKNATVNSNSIQPSGIRVYTGYSGTITQNVDFATGTIVINAGTWAMGINNFSTGSGGDTVVSGGTLTIGASSSTGLSTRHLLIETGGTVTCSGASKLNVSGDFENNSGTFTKSSSTVTLTGTGTINAHPGNFYAGGKTFNNLILGQPSGTTRLISPIYVYGAVHLGTGTIVSDSGQRIGLYNSYSASNWIDDGVTWGTSPSRSTVEMLVASMDPANPNVVPGYAYPNLTINCNQGNDVTKPICYTKIVNNNITSNNFSLGTNQPGAATMYFYTNGFDLTVNGNLTAGGAVTKRTGQLLVSDGDILDVNGNVTIYDGSGNTNRDSITLGTGSAMSVSGNWTNSDTFTSGADSLVTFDGVGNQQIITSTATQTNTFHDLTFNNNTNTNTLTFVPTSGTPTLDVDGLLTVTKGNLSPAGYNTTLGGGLTFSDTGTNGTLTRGAGTLTFDGSGTWSDNRSTKGDLGSISLNGTAGTTVTLGSSVKANTIVVNTDNTFTVGTGGYQLELTGNGQFPNQPIQLSGGSFDTAGSTVLYSGIGTNIGIFPVAYGNLTFTPASTSSYALIDITQVDGDITINSNATLDGTENNLGFYLGGSWLNTGTFTAGNAGIYFQGAGTQTIGGSADQTFFSWTISKPSGEVKLDVNVILTANDTAVPLYYGTDIAVNLQSYNLTITGNGPDQTIMASVGSAGFTYITQTTGKVIFLGPNSNIVIENLTGTHGFGNIQVGDGGLNNVILCVIDMGMGGSTFQFDNVTIKSGSELSDIGTDSSIAVSGNWANSGTFTPSSGTVTFNGANQMISGSTTFNNLTKTDVDNNSTDVRLTFDNAATQTINGLLTLQGIDDDDRVNLVSDAPGNQWSLVSNGTFDISYVETADSDASGGLMIVHANTNNNGNNINWGFDTITGTLYNGIAGSPITTGKTIHCSVNGGLATTAETNGSGVFTVSPRVVLQGDYVITVFVSGETEKGSTVVKISASGSLTGIHIYQNYTTLRNEGSITAIANTDLASADNLVDTDLLFLVDGSDKATFTQGLYILTGKTYSPNGDIQIGGNYTNAGAYTAGSNTTYFSKSSDTQTLNSGGVGAGRSFNNVSHTAGGIVQLSANDIEINGDFTNSSGTFDTNGKDMYVAGSWTNSAAFTAGLRTVTFDGSNSGKTINQGSSAFASVTFNGPGYWTLANDLSVYNDNQNAVLTITQGTLDMATFDISTAQNCTINGGTLKGGVGSMAMGGGINNFTITAGSFVAPAIVDFSDIGSYTHIQGQGTSNWTDNSSTLMLLMWLSSDLPADNYNNLVLSADYFGYSLVGDTTINGYLTLTDSVGVSLNVGDHSLSVGGDLTIGGQCTLTADLGSINAGGNWINNGTFTANSSTVTFNGTNNQAINTNNQPFYNLVVSTNGTPPDNVITTSGTLDVDGDFSLNGDNAKLDLTANSSAMSVAGDFYLATHTQILKGPSMTFDGTTATTYTDENSSTQNIGTVTLNKTDTSAPNTNNKLTVNSNITVDSISIDGTLLSYDTLAMGGAYTLNLAGSVATPLNLNINGKFTANNSTVQYAGVFVGGNVDVATVHYSNLQFAPVSAQTYVLTGNLDGVNNISGSVTIGANATLDTVNGIGYAMSVGINWTNSGTFLSRTGTVTFFNLYIGKTIDAGNSHFYNVTFDGAGASWSPLNNKMYVDNDLKVAAGIFDNAAGSADIEVRGNVACSASTCGTINMTTNTFTQNVTDDKTFGTSISGTTTWTFNNLMFGAFDMGTPHNITTSTAATGDISIKGDLRIDDAEITLDAGNRTWHLTGSGMPFQPYGGFAPNTSTFSYESASDTTITSLYQGNYSQLTYYNLQTNPAAGTPTYTVEASASFLAGTKVLTESGEKNIESVKQGEKVKTYDLNNDQGAFAKVTSTSHRTRNQYYIINDRVKTTGNHVFILSDKSQKPVSTLKSGDVLVTDTGTERIDSIKIIKEAVQVYDLEVENYHLFYADNYLVHNGEGGGASGPNIAHDFTLAGTGHATVDALTNQAEVYVLGDFTIGPNQTFSAAAINNLWVYGNWSNSGTFNANGGAAAFRGTEESTISGETTFFDLATDTSLDGAKTIKFTAGTTQTITHLWTPSGGAEDNILTLRSTSEGDPWYFNIAEENMVSGDFINVKDSYSANTKRVMPSSSGNVDDAGNNRGWLFGPANPTDLAQSKITNTPIGIGGWIGDTSIKFTATTTDPTLNDTLYLCAEVDQIGTAFASINGGDICGSGVASTEGAPATVSVTVEGLTPGQEYHWQVQFKDSDENYSSFVGYAGNTENPPTNPAARDFGIDNTAPASGVVNDGLAGDVDTNDGSLTSLAANWSFADTQSGVNKYELALRRQSDSNYWNFTSRQWQIDAFWQDYGTSSSDTFSNLILQTDEIYYSSVKATDNAGNTGEPVDSNGISVLPQLSFNNGTNLVQFYNLNLSNNYSDTKDQTLTTSTNASNGYIVRAYTTGPFSSVAYPSQQIEGFKGSWANPEDWASGDHGLGYTSWDDLVVGVDRFATHTKYAAFSETPGDIVIDHPGPINGTTGSIDNEALKITYKLSVGEFQTAGDYQTTAVFISSAKF